MNTWNPRNEILKIAHQWYWVVLSFLLGALIGWISSLVWPGPYRAVQDIYVGLNAHRATRDLFLADVGVQQFRNLDDYKNWQMEQLNSLALSDSYLEKTLNLLRSTNDYWQNVNLPGLRAMLSIAWRNTGDWHFSAQVGNPDLAKQAVTVWTQVVINEVALAVESARAMVDTDSQMQAVSNEIVDLKTRQISLQETLIALNKWQMILEAELNNKPLSPVHHWSLLSQVTNVADWSVGWVSTLQAAPLIGSSPKDYLDWLVQVRTLIESEKIALPIQIEALILEYEDLSREYDMLADANRGLSGNMEVEQIKSKSTQVTQLRPKGALMLIGGILGLLVWGIIWLVKITSRTD